MIITIEGAPAVGKSTTAAAWGGPVVPEVNKLFGKKNGNPGGQIGYLQKQLVRWQMARQASAAGRTVLLDGDIFQPIWFSALFWKEDWGDFEETVSFFERAVAEGRGGVPDRFVVLTLSETERTRREVERCLAYGHTKDRALAKAARYADFAAFQCSLFAKLGDEFPGLVAFVNSDSAPIATAARIDAAPVCSCLPIQLVRSMATFCRAYMADRREGAA